MTGPQTDTIPTGTELDRLIIKLSREYIAARTERPRDDAKIAAIREELDLLIAMRDAGI
jgi:hypothetical protein